MIRLGGYNSDRFEHGYFDVESFSIPCTALFLNQTLLGAIANTTAAVIEYFADVSFGPSSTPLPNIEKIVISRTVENPMGSAQITFLGLSQVAGLVQGAIIDISAGVRIGTITASQRIFRGFVDSVKQPMGGEIRGQIVAFDAGKILSEAPGYTGYFAGNIGDWIVGQCGNLDLGPEFVVDLQCNPIVLQYRLAGWGFSGSDYYPGDEFNYLYYQDYLNGTKYRPWGSAPYYTDSKVHLSFPKLFDAVKTMSSGLSVHFSFINGLGNLVILDPALLASTEPLFDLSDRGIFNIMEVSRPRFNRIPFTGFPNYVPNTAAGAPSYILASGEFNDTSDQAVYGVQEHPPLYNLIPTNYPALHAYVSSVSRESCRATWQAELPFNPFVDIGAVLTHGATKKFVSAVDHVLETTNYQSNARRKRSPFYSTVELRAC